MLVMEMTVVHDFEETTHLGKGKVAHFHTGEISSFHSGKYEDDCLLGCCAV
jgi:hypothetical protein